MLVLYKNEFWWYWFKNILDEGDLKITYVYITSVKGSRGIKDYKDRMSLSLGLLVKLSTIE